VTARCRAVAALRRDNERHASLDVMPKRIEDSMRLIDQYMQRTQDIIGKRTKEEEQYDNELIILLCHIRSSANYR